MMGGSGWRKMGQRPLLIPLAMVLAAESLLIALVLFHLLTFAGHVETLAFLTLAGFTVAIYQLSLGYSIQRAKFLSDYLSRIYTDADLSATFHDLVETYSDATFKRIDKIWKEAAEVERAKTSDGPVFDLFDSVQGSRRGQAGQRYYHPDCFQGSEEERRLDALIGYLDIAGYHYYHKLIPMKDIAAMLNYQLAAFASRMVIQCYLGDVSDEKWWHSSSLYEDSGGAMIPFLYFRLLVADFIRYNEANKAFLKRAQKKLTKRITGRYV